MERASTTTGEDLAVLQLAAEDRLRHGCAHHPRSSLLLPRDISGRTSVPPRARSCKRSSGWTWTRDMESTWTCLWAQNPYRVVPLTNTYLYGLGPVGGCGSAFVRDFCWSGFAPLQLSCPDVRAFAEPSGGLCAPGEEVTVLGRRPFQTPVPADAPRLRPTTDKRRPDMVPTALCPTLEMLQLR